jgi:hypothetical protein
MRVYVLGEKSARRLAPLRFGRKETLAPQAAADVNRTRHNGKQRHRAAMLSFDRKRRGFE